MTGAPAVGEAALVLRGRAWGGKALALGWEHLDFETGELRVARTLDTKAGVLVDDTKRPSRKRTVPLAAELRVALRERWLAAGRLPEGLVFTDGLGQVLDLSNLRARHFKPGATGREDRAAGADLRPAPRVRRH